ncbi:flagellin [Pelagibacterium sp.]|uniref:flagellin N-terminal helical domain-containing protein n=1 Tax=Pelagibacterium sp. TaxID=1967288 RepID=UPI003BABF4DE
MSEVTLSKAVRSNLLHLQNTAKLMDMTQERLATGKKVNSALDNPTNFFTAASLNGRAADIGTLLDAMSNGIRVIEAADNGLTAITKNIESMQSTLRQARQDKSFQTLSLPMADTRSGELTLSGGGFPAGQSFPIALTNAVPASITAGADFALEGGQGAETFTFTGANFDDAADLLTFNLEIDGLTLPIEIDKTIADTAAPPDGNIDTAAEMVAAIEAAVVAAGFDAADFEVSETGGDITIASTSRGPGSSIAITGAAASDGGGADTMDVATSGLDAPTPSDVPADSAAFTITYGTETLDIVLDGDTHQDIAAAITHINDEIAVYNAAAAPGSEINITASAANGRIVLRGPADGSGPAISITDTVAASGDTNKVFGTSGQRETIAPSVADGEPKTVDQLVRDINANPEFKNIIRASNDNGRLRIENLSTARLDMVGLTTDGKLSGGIGTAAVEPNDVRGSLARQFNELRTELDRLVDDASFNGVNLLKGDQLKIVFNESGTSTIEIEAKNAKGEARAINATNLNILEVLPEDLNLDTDIDALLAKMQISLNEVRSQAANLGSTLSVVQNRESFTKEMINTLQTGAANLTLADTNEESANLLALQTRQQLSQTALSLASQADQAVLRLFG